MTDTSTFATMLGQISGLAIQGALACERDVRQIDKDEQLFASLFLVGDAAEMTLSDAIAHVRNTKGHPRRPLLDWWDAPDLKNESASRQLKRAETLSARCTERAAKHPTMENILALALANARVRKIVRLYGGEEEVAHQRRMRGNGLAVNKVASPTSRRITKAALDALGEQLEQLIVACSMDRATVDEVLGTVNASTSPAELATTNWLRLYLEQDNPRFRINKLAHAIQDRAFRRQQQLQTDPGFSGRQVSLSTGVVADHPELATSLSHQPDPAVEDQPVHVPAASSLWPADTGRPRDDSQVAMALLDWLATPPPGIIRLMRRMPNGRVVLTEAPGAPHVREKFEQAIDHADVQKRLRELVPMTPAAR